MAAPEVTLTDPKKYEVDDVIEVPAGESQVIINLPAAVPAGKKGIVRLRVRARLEDV
jgi:hypothetical protein